MILLAFILASRRPAVPKGHPRGSTAGLTEDPAAFLARHAEVVDLLRQGKTLREIEQATGRARNTVLKVKRMMS